MIDQRPTESKAQSVRTIIYAAVAAASVALGASTYYRNQPVEMAEFEKVGKEFYPKFNSPNDATSLKVTVYDEEQATIQSFEVAQEDGRWVIPTHYDYPADASEQLAKTASSIIGIKRGAIISRRESDHVEYGVADPLSKDEQILKGRGDRITIRNGETVLADFIIGKEYPEQEGAYYVRAPGEKETYVAKFKVDLTTRFQDWIDVDLLKIERDTVTDIIVNNYSLTEQTDEQTGQTFMGIENVEEIDITRPKFGEPWSVSEIDPETQEVNSDAVKALVSALVDTTIVGVRPKPEGLTPSLSVTAEAARNPLLIANIRGDLASRGYFLASREEGKISIIAKEGSFYAATNEGLVYELHFGEVFTGDLREIEIGQQADAKEDEESSSEESDTDESAEGESEEEQQSRYLFVKVNFEPKYLGPEPTEPVAPTKPEPVDLAAPLKAPRPGVTEVDPQTNYEIALKAYEDEQEQYKKDLEEYEAKLDAGSKKADELNERLGAWYYVVPAKNVEALRVSKASLLQPKGTDDAKAAEENPAGGQGLPGLPPGLSPPN